MGLAHYRGACTTRGSHPVRSTYPSRCLRQVCKAKTLTEIYAVILVGQAMPISVALIGLIYRRNGRSNNKNGPVIVKRDELWETFRAREANIARLIDAQGEQGRILSPWASMSLAMF